MASIHAAYFQSQDRQRRKPPPVDRLNSTNFIVAYLRPQIGRVLTLGALLILSVSLQLVGPLVVGRFIDTVVRLKGQTPLDVLWSLASLYVLVIIGAELVRLIGTYVGEGVKWAATNLLRSDLARHCLSQDAKFYDAHSPGELLERVDGDATALGSFFSQFVFQLLASGLLLVGIVLVAFASDIRAGLALLGFAVLAGFILHRTRGLGKSEFQKERVAQAALTGFLEERLHGLEDIRANGGGRDVLSRLAVLNHDLAAWSTKAWRLGSAVVVIANWVFVAGFVVALAIGVYLFRTGEGSIGTIYVLMQYSQMMRAPLETIRAQLWDLRRVSASLTRIGELAAIQPEIRSGVGVAWPAGPLSVEFDGVTFGYRPDAPAVHDLSFRLPKGAVLGILGRSGSGKTTITRLLTRLYDPQGGAIRVGDGDIRDAALPDLRHHVALVTQDVQIFQATVRDNIRLFNAEITDQQLLLVVEALGLKPWLDRLPGKLDEVLTSGASGLSVGEAQLLAFARVMLRRPGVVILDEASSRLDTVTQKRVERAIDSLLHGVGGSETTGIVIAHRLETVGRATHILIMENGRATEYGERNALLANPDSAFSRLLASGLGESLS